MLFVEFQVHVGVGIAGGTFPAVIGCRIHVGCFSAGRGRIKRAGGDHVGHAVKRQLEVALHLKCLAGAVQEVTSTVGIDAELLDGTGGIPSECFGPQLIIQAKEHSERLTAFLHGIGGGDCPFSGSQGEFRLRRRDGGCH